MALKVGRFGSVWLGPKRMEAPMSRCCVSVLICVPGQGSLLCAQATPFPQLLKDLPCWILEPLDTVKGLLHRYLGALGLQLQRYCVTMCATSSLLCATMYRRQRWTSTKLRHPRRWTRLGVFCAVVSRTGLFRRIHIHTHCILRFKTWNVARSPQAYLQPECSSMLPPKKPHEL